jgi:alkylhydroperoxidase/carboxymuconolactone decarboxylase family protein YurZ
LIVIPNSYKEMHREYPDLMQAYEAFGLATREAGPLTAREAALVKLAISIGNGLEGATHAHARKAIEAGCTPDELRHVAILSAPTVGFPTMMRAKSWVEDVLELGTEKRST